MMNKIIPLFITLLFASQLATAQFSFGIRAGVSTSDISGQDLNILSENGTENLRLALADANYGIHGGLIFQFKGRRWSIQPEVHFNSNKVDFAVEVINDPMAGTVIKEESYQYLDIPVLIGLHLCPLHFQGGPVGHVFLDSTTELDDFEGYEQDFEDLTIGYQVGGGLDIWNITIDVRYEGNFTGFGEHIEFFDRKYELDDSPSRWLFSLGFYF
jgi:hypothetical protein